MLFGDKYAVYVIAAYAATILILGGMIWSTLVANARARRDLARAEEERNR
jgi:heme exporter protein D